MTKRGKKIIKYLENLTPKDDEEYEKLSYEQRQERIKSLLKRLSSD